jgi:hypothetical protein
MGARPSPPPSHATPPRAHNGTVRPRRRASPAGAEGRGPHAHVQERLLGGRGPRGAPGPGQDQRPAVARLHRGGRRALRPRARAHSPGSGARRRGRGVLHWRHVRQPDRRHRHAARLGGRDLHAGRAHQRPRDGRHRRLRPHHPAHARRGRLPLARRGGAGIRGARVHGPAHDAAQGGLHHQRNGVWRRVDPRQVRRHLRLGAGPRPQGVRGRGPPGQRSTWAGPRTACCLARPWSSPTPSCASRSPTW